MHALQMQRKQYSAQQKVRYFLYAVEYISVIGNVGAVTRSDDWAADPAADKPSTGGT